MTALRKWRVPLVRRLLIAAIAASAAAGAQQSDFSSQGEATEADEELRRYAVEIILFTYDASISSGTEVFVPDAPAPGSMQEGVPITGPYPSSGPNPPASDIDGPSAEFGDTLPGSDTDQPSAEFGDTLPGSDTDQPSAEFGDTLPATDAVLADEELEELIGMDSIDLTVLTPDELTMTDIHERLIRLDAYRPVLWTGWIQIVRDDAETPVIPLRRLGRVPLEFDGDLKLYLSRFLHLVVELALEAPSAAIERRSSAYGDARFGREYGDAFERSGYGYAPPPVYFKIAEDRIIKSGDVRYFDHPKFGILAKLSRVEEVEEPELIENEPSLPGATDQSGLPLR